MYQHNKLYYNCNKVVSIHLCWEHISPPWYSEESLKARIYHLVTTIQHCSDFSVFHIFSNESAPNAFLIVQIHLILHQWYQWLMTTTMDAQITTIPLLATYLENSAAYSGIFWLTVEKWMWKATALSTHSRWIEDSLLRYIPWEEIGSTSERHYSRRK